MKHLPLALLLLVSTAALAIADTPEAILKDFHTSAAQAVERLNQSLEKSVTPLITQLVSRGDSAGAALLSAQLKAKLAGDPVAAPQASAVPLFSLYNESRARILAPIQKSSIARIDSLLKTAGGPKLEVITELGRVRAEIEAGDPPSSLVREWTYHLTATTDHVTGTAIFDKNGTLKLYFPNNNDTGTWKKTSRPDTYETIVKGEKGSLKITGQTAEWNRGAIVRYLRAKIARPAP